MKRASISGRGHASDWLRGKWAVVSCVRRETRGSASSTHAVPTAISSSEANSAAAKPGAMTSSSAAHSSTVRPIGPTWSKLGASGKQPSIETSPYVGLNPTTPQQAAGMRIEPPESVPRAASTSPSASAAAEPPDDPPAIRPGATGFGTVPKCGFSDVTPYANSCRFVLPTFAYPLDSARRTDSAVVDGTCSANTAEPYVVVSPAVSSRSLTASRMPAGGSAGIARKIPSAATWRPYWLPPALRLRRLLDELHRHAARDACALSAAGRVAREHEDVVGRVRLAQGLEQLRRQDEAHVVVAGVQAGRAEPGRAERRLEGSVTARKDDEAEKSRLRGDTDELRRVQREIGCRVGRRRLDDWTDDLDTCGRLACGRRLGLVDRDGAGDRELAAVEGGRDHVVRLVRQRHICMRAGATGVPRNCYRRGGPGDREGLGHRPLGVGVVVGRRRDEGRGSDLWGEGGRGGRGRIGGVTGGGGD